MTQKRAALPRSSASRPVAAFGEAYYRRYYMDPATRVRAGAAHDRLAAFVFGYLGHLGVPVKRVLDLGCGLGHWRAPLKRAHPRASYTGVEFSPYLCETYGWERGSAADYVGRGRFDLVICQSVLQYLGDDEARAAVDNMARLCRGALYLEIITAEDWRDHCDRKLTDGKVHLRSDAWYRKLLGRRFRSAGGGLFLPHESPVVLYQLEKGRF